MYQGMAEDARQWAVEVLTLAAENEGALLYHCTTGKDRTGLLTCYLLSIAGVAAPDIVTDYCVSQVYLRPTYEKLLASGMGHFGNDLSAPFFQTPPEAMQALLDYLDKTYGGVVPFLREIGVTEDTMARIRAKFVEE
jgi:protein-tyrosine phosphatase